jgi:AAA ATPase domain
VVLAGRARELAELERLFERAAGGSGGPLVVIGPSGAGKTTVLDAAAQEARGRGFAVVRGRGTRGQPGRLVWAQLLRDIAAPDSLCARLLAQASPLDLDDAARELAGGDRELAGGDRELAGGDRRLVLVDDVDHGGSEAADLLAMVATRLAGGATVVVAAASTPLGVGPELLLRGLTEDELAAVVPDLAADARHALWVASRGLPGAARSLAVELADCGPGEDPVTYLALHAVSRAEFLEVDLGYVRLLETALEQARDDILRARLQARLARALLGDASSLPRRRALIEDAIGRCPHDTDPRVGRRAAPRCGF